MHRNNKKYSLQIRGGEVWGFVVKFHNLPKERDFELREEMLHPPIKQPNGEILKKGIVKRVIEQVWILQVLFYGDS